LCLDAVTLFLFQFGKGQLSFEFDFQQMMSARSFERALQLGA
jgi:hypothetical protein